MSFRARVDDLPRLGIGISTEYGAARSPASLDVSKLRREHPAYAGFLEIGVEIAKGIDDDAKGWLAGGGACTYHFLDVNLDEYGGVRADGADDAWLVDVNTLCDVMKPAWLCGDAGLWHFGARDRLQMLLLPPILVDEVATQFARGVSRLREQTGKEVLPENPPGTAFVGDLHVLDFFHRVVERADCGMLLDVAHLAMFQRVTGNDALFGLDAFPLERVVEVHVAGGTARSTAGFAWVEDTHGTDVLSDTWRIFDAVVARAKNLKAVVFECERNANDGVLDGFARIASRWPTP